MFSQFFIVKIGVNTCNKYSGYTIWEMKFLFICEMSDTVSR